MDRRYDPHAIEEKWQRLWKERDAYRTPDESDKPKFYALDFFPYPSGDGLSVGHCRNYVPTDAVSRYQAHAGASTCCIPMGWDAFGLPAENYAIKMGVHPRGDHRAQHRQLPPPDGPGRPVVRLVARGHQLLPRLLPLDAVVLPAALRARAGVPGARGSSGGARSTRPCSPTSRWTTASAGAAAREVTKKDLEQWFFRITDYAERLLDDLDDRRLAGADQDHAAQLDRAQRGRRGRLRHPGPRREAHGLHHAARHALRRHVHGAGAGASAGGRAHDAGAEGRRSRRTRTRRGAQSEIERLSTEKEKTGVFTGAYAINPVNDAPVPDLDRRLRAHGLRHRRHHGGAGARRARLRSSPPSSRSRSWR